MHSHDQVRWDIGYQWPARGAGGGNPGFACGCARVATDVIWRPLFFARFTGTPGVPVTLATDDFFNEYCERLVDPRPGDAVEVAWEGTFNLLCSEFVTTYEGRAWWSAVITEQNETSYKIHYPQWDASVWDEWVPRHRIRWPPRLSADKVRPWNVCAFAVDLDCCSL